MPPIIDPKKCNGCEGREESFCEEACPGDLLYVGADGRSHCHAARDCWDCMSCVKMCPRGAIETKMPYQLGYHKATLRPIMGKDSITWKCTDIHGKTVTYRYRNRLERKG